MFVLYDIFSGMYMYIYIYGISSDILSDILSGPIWYSISSGRFFVVEARNGNTLIWCRQRFSGGPVRRRNYFLELQGINIEKTMMLNLGHVSYSIGIVHQKSMQQILVSQLPKCGHVYPTPMFLYPVP